MLEFKFEIGKKNIGEGTFGDVRRLKSDIFKDVVGKIIRSDQTGNEFDKEVQILQELHHPNVIRYYGYTIVDSEKIIIMDEAKQRDLDRFLTYFGDNMIRFPREKRLIMCQDICRGMVYLHSKDIIHRDLKCKNVLLDEKLKPMISDFGISKKSTQPSNNYNTYGTFDYKAPECHDYCMDPKFTMESDIYSLGMVLYSVATGKNKPYGDKNEKEVIPYVCEEQKRPDLPNDLNQEFIDLIKECWDQDPGKRPNITQVFERMNAIKTLDPVYKPEIIFELIKDGNLPGIRPLVEKSRVANLKFCGSKFDGVDMSDCALIHFASRYGHKEIVDFLISKGANLEMVDNKQMTPLLYASCYDQIEVMKLLINMKANILAKDSNNMNSLHYASKNGNIAIVELLISKNVKINDQWSKYGKKAIHFAAQSQKNHIEIVDFLLRCGEMVNEKSTNPTSPSGTALHFATFYGYLDLCKFLISKEADKDSLNINNYSPIHYATKIECFPVFSYLYSLGANIHSTVKGGRHLVHLAAENGNIELLEFLLNLGGSIDINIKDDKDYSAIHIAVLSGNLKFIKVLLEKGVNVNEMNYNGNTPLHIAAKKGKDEIIRFLIEHCIDPKNNENQTPLHLAVYKNNLQAVKILIENTADINAQDSHKSTPLHIEILSGNHEFIKVLLEKGANVNEKNCNGNTPLHIDVKKGKDEIIRFLIEHCIDPKNNENQTPLHLAVYKNNLQAVKILIENTADINAQDSHKLTPLHIAAKFGYCEIVKFLLEKDADVSIKDDEENTPYDLTINEDIQDMIYKAIHKKKKE